MQNTTGRQSLLGVQLDACLTALFSTPKIVADTTYTLTAADNYRSLIFTNDSDITLTVPHNLGAGFRVGLVQYGGGEVTPTAGTGVTLFNAAPAGRYALASLYAPVADHFAFSSASGNTTTYNDGTNTGVQFNAEDGTVIGFVTTDGTDSELDIVNPNGVEVAILKAFAGYSLIESGSSRLVANFGTGFNQVDLPTPVLGMVALILDSNTNTWGASITTTGADTVLALYNGSNWTVIGK